MPTIEKYIERRSGGFRVRLPKGMRNPRCVGTFKTIQDARDARDKEIQRITGEPPILPLNSLCRAEIEGITLDSPLYDVGELWDIAIRQQKRAQEIATKRSRQTIRIPHQDKPFALSFLSDFHLGDPGTNYEALRRDVLAIKESPRLFCGFMGDGVNNWIVSKLQHLERQEALQFDAEMELFASVLEDLSESFLFVLSGNHELWTDKLAGFDRIRHVLRGTRALYDPHEINFSLLYGDEEIRFKARHQWKYNSVFNLTHAIEVGWERGSCNFDIGIGAHTHQGTFCRPFVRHGRMRYAVLMGTYKTDGEYGRELGLPEPYGVGSGALLFFPDGRRPEFFTDLVSCSEYLSYLCS